jgi:hypothetical protein
MINQTHLSKANARKFYIEELGWTSDQFEAVDWDALHWTISKKKLMYSLWLSKQASKFCGTRLQVSRMQEGADDRCPNCHCPEERASHLNLYPSLLQTRQFLESVADLEKWLTRDHTHPEISFWVPRYLKAQARTTFCDLINYAPCSACLAMSSQMKALALGQDNIGWTHMLEGKISGHFHTIQARHLRQRNARINGRDWVRLFITRLLKISHTQWIFCYFTLHD